MYFMWQKGFRYAAAASLLGFHYILRSGDFLDAKWCHLALSDDMGTLLLPRTKSGTRYGYPESVIIHDHTLLRLLRRLQLISPNHGSVAGIVPSHYRRLFAQALQSLGVANLGYEVLVSAEAEPPPTSTPMIFSTRPPSAGVGPTSRRAASTSTRVWRSWRPSSWIQRCRGRSAAYVASLQL